MIAFVTSCGRYDLLTKTLESFGKNMPHKIFTIIHEDGLSKKGQHQSIIDFLEHSPDVKYYVHLEEDWQFENTYDWISESIKIMDSCEDIIKVICRKDSPHPVDFDGNVLFGIMQPWRDNDGRLWHGFGWNPGVTRLDYLKRFTNTLKNSKWEQDISEAIYLSGYRTALLKDGVCTHIGDGRSTHE